MTGKPRRRRRIALLAALIGIVLAFGLGEAAARLLPVPEPPGKLYYRDRDGNEVGLAKAAELNIVAPVQNSPRHRMGFTPGAHFYTCYRGHPQPWFDDRGCVEVRFSSHGIREREEIGPHKPTGQKRILCLGDSFTFGWGVRVEDCWVRLVENELRKDDDNLRTVNCGAAGTTVVDEYWWGLKHRFHALQPDVVLVTLCLNDLLITDAGLALTQDHRLHTPSVLVNRVAALFQPHPLEMDPNIDWVEYLLSVPPNDPLYEQADEVAWDMLWPSETPQNALKEMHAWCRDREIPMGVVIWPFLQNLDEGQYYPLTGMHERVRAFCRDQGIPFLDLLPVLRGQPAQELWVTPADMHANPRAHELATPAITRFLKEFSGV